MKLHSDILNAAEIFSALSNVQRVGLVAPDVDFVVFNRSGSRSRRLGFDIQLGTDESDTGPTKSRHYKNSGTSGADRIYAATYDEWGWFIGELFARDPEARFGPYNGRTDFNAKTKGAYVVPVAK